MVHRLLICGLLLALGASLNGCTVPAPDPDYTNPFDPELGADPFELSARLEPGGVRLTWQAVPIEGLVRYVVLHSDQAEAGFVPTATQPDIIGSTLLTTMRDPDYLPNLPNFYKVRAVGPGETLTALSRTVAAVVFPPPRVALLGGAEQSATRFVMLEAQTAAGESLELANDAAFTVLQSFPVDQPNDVITTAWTLPTVAHPDSNVIVHVRALQGSEYSQTGTWEIDVSFRPRLALSKGVASAMLDSVANFQWSPIGLTRYRLGRSQIDLAAAAWSPPDSMVIWPLDPSNSQPRRVHGEFEGDFGYSTRDSLLLTPQLVAASITGFTLADGDSTTAAAEVLVSLLGSNLAYMRLSEDPAFGGVPWVPYQTPTSFTLSAGAGRKVVYARVRHAWDPVGDSASASITRLAKGQANLDRHLTDFPREY